MALLTLLLLLPFLSLSTSSSHSQTLTLTALPSPPSLSTAFPETLIATETATDTEDLTFRIANRDALHSDLSSSEIFNLRLRRDARRAAAFSGAVVSGLSLGSGEYFTRVGFGTPAKPAFLVLDTGSDVIWIQCQPCRSCYSQSDPIFLPSKSTTFSSIHCETPECKSLDTSGCDRNKTCLYQVSYGDGSVTTGELSTETLTFRAGARLRKVVFGCGHDNQGLFVAAAGLLGLGRGPLSFPSQAARGFGEGFSYCLVDRTSSNNTTKTSLITFGASSAAPKAAVFTPMLRNPKMDTFYYVELTAVSVGGSVVPGASVSDLKLDPSTGRGGVIVDSGTSVTRLARPAYLAMRDAFRAGAVGLGKVTEQGFSLFDTCYDLSGKSEVKVPTVALHFGGGATVSLPAENYLIPVDSKGTFCFAFAGTDGGVSIIGNIQQQGFRVVFDSGRGRVGFAPRGC